MRGARSFSTTGSAKALVKIGSGEDSDWDMEVRGMTRMALLEALAGSRRFGESLKGVALDKCKVTVGSVEGAEPTDEELQRAKELRGTRTISEVLEAGSPGKIFVRVQLPSAAGVDSATGADRALRRQATPGAAFAELADQAKRVVALRKRLQDNVPWLLAPGALSLSSAGLTSLSTASAAVLAEFGMPAVDQRLLIGPKGLESLLAEGGKFLVEGGRVTLVDEFLAAMANPRAANFGVLLSGPNGIGKSAIGVLCFLACLARGLPIVCIPRAANWVAAAADGRGDAFFLEVLVSQNADIILADPDLMSVFEPLLRRKDELGEHLNDQLQASRELGPETMQRLTALLKRRPDLRIGVVIDETQKITEAAEMLAPTAAARVFFRNGWYGWQQDPGTSFVRMDIASSHGLRELTLPSGEKPRLRYVLPWPKAVAMQFLGHEASPGFVDDHAARKRLHYICGGVVRSLLEAKRCLHIYGSSPAGLDNVEAEMRDDMRRSCDKWLKQVGPPANAAAAAIANLVNGTAAWEDLKPAYDQGLVALDLQSRNAVPVSSVAASVLHQALAARTRHDLAPLESFLPGKARGNAFEAQLHALLDGCNFRSLKTRTVDGSAPSHAVTLRTDYSLPFLTVAEARSAATKYLLYLPKSETYPCDAIIVPPEDDPSAPVILLEFSVTRPTNGGRLTKLLGWFSPVLTPKAKKGAAKLTGPAAQKRAPEEFGDFINAVKKAHPNRRVEVVLCWLGRFDGGDGDNDIDDGDGAASAAADTSSATASRGSKVSKQQRLLDMAQAARVSLGVLDMPGLEELGIRMKAA